MKAARTTAPESVVWVGLAGSVLWALTTGMPAYAQDAPIQTLPKRNYLDLEIDTEPQAPRVSYALGLALSSSPEYAGSSRRDVSLKPIAAFRYGRFKISSSGGSGILNFGEHAESSGVSADLISSRALKLKLSARIGGGRKTSDSIDLAGLPEISKTVFTRLSASYALTGQFSLNSTASWDVLGRGSGLTLSVGLGHSQYLNRRTVWNTGIGLTLANATHMQSYFGVPGDAATPTRAAYQPGAGIKDLSLGTGFMTALSPRWIAFGQLGYSRLLGQAADSPLTTGANNLSATVGIGYRCCR